MWFDFAFNHIHREKSQNPMAMRQNNVTGANVAASSNQEKKDNHNVHVQWTEDF